MTEIVPPEPVSTPKRGFFNRLLPGSRTPEHPRQDVFKYERWLDPKRPTIDTSEHTDYVQSLAYETREIFRKKGYLKVQGINPPIMDAISDDSDHILISDDRFRGKFNKKDDTTWVDKDKRAVEINERELKKLEEQVSLLDTDVRKLTQDRIVARYLFLRRSLSRSLNETEPYLKEVIIMEANPRVMNIFVSAAIAREAKGDALRLYDSGYDEDASYIYLFGHELAVRTELARCIPPTNKIKIPHHLSPDNG